MKIESIIRRDHGTKLTIGTQDYHFVASEDGRHLCEVEDESHIDRLLSIKEGFRAVEDEAPATPADPADPAVSAPVAKAEGEAKPKGGRKAKVAEPSAKAPADPADPAVSAPVAKAEGEA